MVAACENFIAYFSSRKVKRRIKRICYKLIKLEIKINFKNINLKIEEVKKDVAQLRIDFKKDMEILKNKLVISLGSVN